MNNIYFISDIHLDPKNSEVTNKFINFITNKSCDMKELYILGDLFEFWIDDKYDITQNNLIITTLKNIVKNGTKVFLTHGNRDFLIGNKFSEITHIKILPENYILNLGESKILITHGDLLCTDDIDYQKFRLSHPFMNYPIKKLFKYNIHNVIENKEKLVKKNNFLIADAKNYDNLYEWAKNTLWFGRRIARYKTHILSSYDISSLNDKTNNLKNRNKINDNLNNI